MTKKKAYMVRYESGELDVAKRVSQRASKSEQQERQIADLEATVAKQQREFPKGNSDSQRKPQKPGNTNPKGERPARSEQTCAASGRWQLVRFVEEVR